MKYVSILFVFVFALSVNAQDKIMLLSGKVLEGKILSTDTSGINYQYTKKGKVSEIHLDNYRIYSLEYADGKSAVIYERDSISGRTYTVKQMGAFVSGERYAFEHFKGAGTVLYGFLAGAAGGLVVQNIFAAPGALVIGFSTLIPPPQKINPADVADKELLKEKYFLEGYKRVIRSKRLGRGLISALGGAVVGIGVAILTE
ncbi:MAG: hypothetical protein JKY53_06645 [Flavobacteriales bacterium]|nr:hypothetical protein [Flavobacteriales bacterium]